MTKVFVTVDQTPKQAELLMAQFTKTRSGETHSAMTIMNLCLNLWGLRYDWHDWANVLDEMQRHGQIETAGKDQTLTQYYIK